MYKFYVLLNNCKQNITSLSLLVGTTVREQSEESKKTVLDQTTNLVVFRLHMLLLSSLILAAVIWSRGYKTFFMVNSAEHEISTAHKN